MSWSQKVSRPAGSSKDPAKPAKVPGASLDKKVTDYIDGWSSTLEVNEKTFDELLFKTTRPSQSHAVKRYILHKAMESLSSDHDRKVFETALQLIHVADVNDTLFFPSEEGVRSFLRFLQEAKKSLDVCVFTITDDRISQKLIDAHKRGVKVRVITDDEKAHDLGSDVEKLAAAGVPCQAGRQPFRSHAQQVLRD
eukprot:TRINITY_DN1252_c0_g1_i2.p1 TRINITY_DN1252_c0_g1~~TRINITY_DN1252_c0_g1_i2.p1  ORF type:complete len:195 (+),score=53.33 TRINITY_DN1252_c0_g1_i2:63-647(+)